MLQETSSWESVASVSQELQECCRSAARDQHHSSCTGCVLGLQGLLPLVPSTAHVACAFIFSSKPRRAKLGRGPNPAPHANAVAIWMHQRASSIAFRLPRRAKLGKGPNPAPRWLGNTLAWVLGLVGPKGLEFAKYSIGEPLCVAWLGGWFVCNVP